MTPAIEIKNLTLKYQDKEVFSNLNLTLEEGVFCCLFGNNGVGKTSLIKCICNLEKFSGEIKIFSKKTKKNIIGYLPQNNFVSKNCLLKVYDAVSIGRYLKNGIFKKNSREDEDIINRCIEITGIKDISKELISNISGGQLQKVSLARILAQEPKLILLDEPLLNLDKKSQKNFLKLIEILYKKFNFTCVMVLHDKRSVPKCCKKILTLKNGKII